MRVWGSKIFISRLQLTNAIRVYESRRHKAITKMTRNSHKMQFRIHKEPYRRKCWTLIVKSAMCLRWWLEWWALYRIRIRPDMITIFLALLFPLWLFFYSVACYSLVCLFTFIVDRVCSCLPFLFDSNVPCLFSHCGFICYFFECVRVAFVCSYSSSFFLRHHLKVRRQTVASLSFYVLI